MTDLFLISMDVRSAVNVLICITSGILNFKYSNFNLLLSVLKAFEFENLNDREILLGRGNLHKHDLNFSNYRL